MARCGCSGAVCSCVVTGDGTTATVSGAGSAANPYVITANPAPITIVALDTPSVHTVIGGANPNFIVSGNVIPSPDAGNILVLHPNGVYVPAATMCVSTDAGNVATLGADGCIFVPTPATNSFSAGNGIAPIVGGVIMTCLSTDAGNSLVFGTDGCLFVPASAGTPVTVAPAAASPSFLATVTGGPNYLVGGNVVLDPAAGNLITDATGLLATIHTACGLTGSGTAASPLAVTTSATAWPFACPQDTSMGAVYCDPTTGAFGTDPTVFSIALDNRVNSVIPAPPDTIPNDGVRRVMQTSPATTFTNPSSCYSMKLFLTSSWDVDYNIPAGGEVQGAIQNDAVSQIHNTGNITAQQDHWQMPFPQTFIIPPGGNLVFTSAFAVSATGTAGTTITRYQYDLSAIGVVSQ